MTGTLDLIREPLKHDEEMLRKGLENRKEISMKETMLKTTYLMQSEDYKDRLRAEYIQTKIRYEKLQMFITKTEANQLKGKARQEDECSFYILKDQQDAMGKYLSALAIRAEFEGIDLSYELVFKIQ